MPYDAESAEPANIGPAVPVRETEKALAVVLEADGEEHWIPKSVIHDDSECYSMKSGAGDLIVAGWFADKEGLR